MLLSFTLMLLIAAQSMPPQATTVTVTDNPRVEIHYQAGLVRVRVGEARSLTYRASTPVVLETSGSVVQIRPRAPQSVEAGELTVTVPPGANVSIDGWYASVDVSGPVGAIRITTREGAVSVSGGSAGADIRTVNGSVAVSGTRGSVSVDSTAGAITLTDLPGDARVEGTSGDVVIRGSRLSSLEVSMFSSRILFEGRIDSAGRYTLASHTGDIELRLPADTSATVTFLTIQGVTRTRPAVAPQHVEGAASTMRRAVYRLGGGAAGVEVRTFGGNLSLQWDGR